MLAEKPTLDYARPQAREKFRGWLALGLLLGIVVTPPALFLAVASAGAGHGNYGFARALFPLPMLATLLTFHNSITTSLIVAAVLQFPIYGLAVGYGLTYGLARRRILLVPVVFFIHTVGVIVCFSGLIPNFP